MPPQVIQDGDALTPASVVARSSEPASARLDDEIVTMSVRRGPTTPSAPPAPASGS
jgi:hypothetical protein